MHPKELRVAYKNRIVRPSVRLTVRYKSCVTQNTDKGNSIKFHRKIKQSEKLCRAQNLGFHDQGQGHNRRSKVCHLRIVCQP